MSAESLGQFPVLIATHLSSIVSSALDLVLGLA